MSTFAEFTATVYGIVDNKNTRVLAHIQDATVRWLQELSKERMTLLEASFSFDLVQGQQTYDATVTGFPADVIEFDNVWSRYSLDATGYKYEVKGPVSISEASLTRGPLVYGSTLGIRPKLFAFHDNKMWFSPVPSTGQVTIGGEYLRDGTKDSATGATITTASTTHSNPWFTRGKHVLQNAVLYDTYMNILKDYQVASAFEKLYQDGVATLRKQQAARSGSSGQARYSLGDQRDVWF